MSIRHRITLTSPSGLVNIDSEPPMRHLAGRSTRVTLASVSVLPLLVTIAWLLIPRIDGVTRVSPVLLTDLAGPVEAAAARARRDSPARAPDTSEKYVLESGPFTALEAADRLEDQLNHLGYATTRFRKQDVTRLYVVTATGFASPDEAERAARQLGRGAVVRAGGAPEVRVDRLPSLGEAIAVARPLRARGIEVRVSEGVSPTVVYHIRYGRFGKRADAETLSRDLARSGVKSRVVQIRQDRPPVTRRRAGSGAPPAGAP